MVTAAEFLLQHPICCFCGGGTAGTEIDHQPAKIVFPDKQRPKGLEFPACSLCNRQTSPGEALLAFICRFAGSHRPHAAKDFHRLKDIVRSVERSFPRLLKRTTPVLAKQRGVLVRTGAIDVNYPGVDLALCRIAAKLSLAVYYAYHGRAASKDCRINTLWTHSQNGGAIQSVQNLVALVPNQATLQMGQWTTDQSFFLRYHVENGYLFSIAVFHESVALIAQLREPQIPPIIEQWHFVMAPMPGRGIVPI